MKAESGGGQREREREAKGRQRRSWNKERGGMGSCGSLYPTHTWHT